MSNRYRSRLDRYKSEIDNRLASLISKSSPESIYKPSKYVLRGDGKRIRPLLSLLSCKAIGGNWRNAVTAGIAIETLHNFTLVHDDLLDRSEYRRGRPTVHCKWNDNIAILTGDALVAVAFKSLLNTKSDRISEVLKIFTDGLLEVCEGQAYDMEMESLESVSSAMYYKMIEKKTASLIKMACAIGGVVGEGSNEAVSRLRRFGKYLGIAFQIQDDLLDVQANRSKLGKPMYRDIANRKRTFLMLNALENASKTDGEYLNTVFSQNPGKRINVNKVMAIYNSSGALRNAERAVNRYTVRAENELDNMQQTDGLKDLKRFILNLLGRDY